MIDEFLNLAGFGMHLGRQVREEEPFTFRATTMPNYDRNLRSMCSHTRADVRPGRDA